MGNGIHAPIQQARRNPQRPAFGEIHRCAVRRMQNCIFKWEEVILIFSGYEEGKEWGAGCWNG
jgi:hypothetical protein